jgi:Family of unknown function (DUF6446)
MIAKLLFLSIPVTAVVFGVAIYYTQIYAYYYPVEPRAGMDVQLVSRATGLAEPIPYDGFEGIDADSSPIRYKACFTTTASPAVLRESYEVAPEQKPRLAPGWFDCFDAGAIGAEIDAGTAQTFLGTKNIAFGVDRIVAVTDDGRGYVWHELNNCGEKAYDGTIVGEECPAR